MNKIESCPICKEKEFKHWLTCTDHFYSKEQFVLLQCLGCHFVFTQNVPNGIERYYQFEDYVSHSDTKKGIVNTIYHKVRDVMLSRKYSWIKSASVKEKGRLLDIGAGTGYFLNHVAKKGWSVCGVEQSQSAKDYAQASFSLNMLSSIEEAKDTLEAKSFDVITLWHVLEHIDRLDACMETILGLLKDEGVLVIALPNCASYDAKHYREYWAAYDVPRHLWHFSPKSFSVFADTRGYVLENIKPMHFDSFYISMMSEKYKGGSFGMMKGLFFGFISFVTGVFSKERCSSVVYFLKKKKDN